MHSHVAKALIISLQEERGMVVGVLLGLEGVV